MDVQLPAVAGAKRIPPMPIQFCHNRRRHEIDDAPALPPHTRPSAALAAPCLDLVLADPPCPEPRRASPKQRRPCDPPVNTAVFPEVRPNATADAQSLLPLATEGVLRYVWEGKFGSMLIEVAGDKIFVNGELVEPANP